MSSTNGNGTNGTSGHASQVASSIQVNDKLARYRTALVAIVEMVKREAGYQKMNDQLLVRQIERMLDEDNHK